LSDVVIAEIDSAGGWGALVEAFRRAVAYRNTTLEAVSELGGLPARYANKLLAPEPMRNIGPISLGALLGALGVKLVMVQDDDAFARVADRLPTRRIGRPSPAERGVEQSCP
jgi:hypothetical protein